MSDEPAGTYEEWRVSGQPGHGYPPYEFVWSRRLTPNMEEDPEIAARTFVDQIRTAPERSNGVRSPWIDGPHLSRRTVTIGGWSSDSATEKGG